jgi:hypothetical protein
MREYHFDCMRPSNSLLAGFIAVVLSVLTAFLVVLGFRVQAILVDVNNKTDRAVKIGNEIATMLSAEATSIVGFQATNEVLYQHSYQAQRRGIADRVRSLDEITRQLGESVQEHFRKLRSAIDGWHESVDSREVATRRLSSVEFRNAAFERLSVMRRAQANTNRFNEAVLQYHYAERSRLQQLSYLFIALAAIFGPLAISALVLMAHVLRRLDKTSASMESRAREEAVLRQVGQLLTAGITMPDVLRGITEATALLVQADDVIIETVDAKLNEVTCVSAFAGTTPPIGDKCPYVGSLAQAVLETGSPA